MSNTKPKLDLQAAKNGSESNTPHGISTKPTKQQHKANYTRTIKYHRTPTTSNVMSDTKTKLDLQAASNGPQSNIPHDISKPTKQQHSKANYTKTIKSHRTYSNTPEVSQKSIKWQQQAQPSIKWTKNHIDAYLAIAEVAMEWIVEPGGVELDTGRGAAR
jgi:hypothetical protein